MNLFSKLLLVALLPSVFLGCDAQRKRKDVRRKVCQSNLNSIFLAICHYRNSNGGKYPVSLSALTEKNGVSKRQLFCPNTQRKVYTYAVSKLEFGGKKVLAYDAASNHNNYGNILYEDGTVQSLEDSGWQEFISLASKGTDKTPSPNPKGKTEAKD